MAGTINTTVQGMYRGMLVVALLAVPSRLMAQGLEYTARAQVSGEVDDNVREDPVRGIADEAVRFFGSLSAIGQTAYDITYHLTGNGGYRGYRTFTSENRLVGQSRLALSRVWENGFRMEVSGGFITENYQQDSRDNLTTLFRLDLTLPREYSVFRRMQVAYQRLYNDYRRSTFFDHNEHRLEINGYQPLTRRLTVLPSVTVGLRQFDRVAVARVRNAGFNAVQAMDPQQADFFAEPAIRLQYFRRILLEGSYMYRVFRSNSYGFSFREHRIGMIVGSRFFFNSTLKILADLAAKQYRERGPNILTDLDEDREADNRGVIELSRAVTQQAAIEMRYEFYRNESRLRRLYYSKSVVSVGLQYRL